MASTARIKRVLRLRVLPVAIWLVTMSLVAYLWSDVGQRSPILGFAEGVTHHLGPTFAGRVQSLPVELGQQVSAGQVLATLDSQQLDGEIRIEQAELDRIRAEGSREQLRALNTAGGIAQASEGTRVELARAQAELRVKSSELAVVRAKRKELSDLLARKLVVRQDLIRVELRQSELETEVEAARAAVKALRPQLASAEARNGKLPEAIDPVRAQLAVVESRLELLLAKRQSLTLRSPCSGRVSAVLHREGDAVPPGQPIVSVTADPTGRVVACAFEYESARLEVGATAILHSRSEGGGTLRGRVVGMGPIVLLPERCWPQPRQATWGRQLSILLDQSTPLVAGQAFNVRLEARSTGGEAIAAPARTSEVARSLRVPEALRAVSRFEPSGLIWVPLLSRFVMVSDDTGLPRRDDHAPWLFTMDQHGVVDPKPLKVEGAESFNDLESVAAGSQGSLYLLSSQSYSKKGKRKADRQRMYRLVSSGAGYRVERSVELASLLDALPDADRSALGIADTRALNIEGMTASDEGGVLIGLKAPLDAEGRALVWHLRSPDRLLGSGSLKDAGLRLWGRIKLGVEADGKPAAGGIAELLQLPDGSVLIAATASGVKSARQAGSLWHASRPASHGAQLQARRLRSLPGKPEGLALSPRPRHMVVVFDADAGAPSWLELPWPRD